jgi:serine/threonine-protein kinase
MTFPDPSTESEERLAQILEDLIASSRDGGQPDLEAVIAAHPEFAAEIRELWATAMIAEGIGSFTGDPAEIVEVSAAMNEVATPGRVVGDYELLEEIGRGGMGLVFRARQRSLNRIVALKMILSGSMASVIDTERFRAEAEAAAQLNHPHIVPVYEVGKHDGHPFFSMKFIEGTTLSRKLTDGPLSPRDAAALLIPVCRAIAAAHQHGVLHRDLKPANILIDEDGLPYVTDFGLAKRITPTEPDEQADVATLTALTQSGAVLGTPGYMAPEQAAGQRGNPTAATDVYGLGALLYAMLTGRAPFKAASPLDTVLMVLEQDPLPPRFLNPHADRDLEMICLKCLQKPADLRYRSVDALADDLEAYLANEPISARSSRFSDIVVRAFRETHHASVLENWGLLWMWHSLVLLVLCFITNWLQFRDIESRWPYVGLWSVGLGIWAGCFWNLRRRAGPITFVERQIAHVWAGSMIASTFLFGVEWALGMDVLELSPVLGLISGMVFLTKAGMLTGRFYVQAIALFVTAAVMAILPRPDGPNVGVSLFGVVSGACFFFPGLKYYRQRVGGGRSRS